MTILECLFSFKGRMCRRDYWLKGVLVLSLLGLLLNNLAEHASAGGAMLLGTADIARLYPISALFVKRLHDRNRSGWFAVVPILLLLLWNALQGFVEAPGGITSFDATSIIGFGFVALFLVLTIFPIAFFKGTAGPNRFGDDPIGVQSAGRDREISRDTAGQDGAARKTHRTLFVITGVLLLGGFAVLLFYSSLRSKLEAEKHFKVGQEDQVQGRWAAAIWEFDQAIRLNAKLAIAYVSRGDSYQALGQQQRAIQDYDDALRLNLPPAERAKAYVSRGDAHRDLGRYQQALQEYDEAIRLDPTFSEAYASRGIAYYKLRQHQQAIQAFDKAIHLNPNYALAYALRAAVRTLLNRDAEAEQDKTRAIDLGFDRATLERLVEEAKRRP